MYNNVTLVLFGSLAGFSIGATIGPIALLCIHRSMASGFAMGFVTGLGATLANMILSSIAVFGMSLITFFFKSYESWMQLIASIIIILIALKVATTPYKKPVTISKDMADYASSFLSAFLLNMSTPISISSYASFIALFNIEIITVLPSILFLTGILLGNVAWWIIISAGSVSIYRVLDERYLKWINVIGGILLAFAGLAGALFALHRLWR